MKMPVVVANIGERCSDEQALLDGKYIEMPVVVANTGERLRRRPASSTARTTSVN